MAQAGGYGYAIDSVENAAKTLLMLRDRPSIRAVDVAAELGTARSTAHRMVQTLAQAGLLRRNESDRSYSAGAALVELGLAVVGGSDLPTEIAPVLDSLAIATGETTHLLLRERDEVVFVAVAESPNIIRAASRVGTRLPAHVTSAGKCLLAALSREDVLALYPEPALVGGTDDAITDRDRLVAELDEVAERGWAANRSESEAGLVAVSTAVHDTRGTAIGAVSVSGPSDRVTPRIDEIGATLRETVAAFEAARAGRA